MRAQRVGVQQVEHGEVGVGEPGGDLGGAPAGLGQRREAGAVAGGEAGLAQPAAVGRRGDLEQARAGAAGEAEAGREVEQRARRGRAVGAGEQPLAVDDHDVLAGGGDAVDELVVDPDQPARPAARRDPDHGVGARVERGRARAGDGQVHVVAADALADAEVENRGVVDRVALDQHDGVGELEVGDRRLQRGVRERALDVERQLAAGA